jgi:hypothetical protein
MLPGIRFLFAAILLSMSILIFGLGAAALLRAAHEEVASVPTRRILPEPVFAQQPEAPAATLAMLRIEPAAPAKAPDDAPVAIPAPEPALEAAPVPAVETDTLAALKTDDIAPAEAEKSEAAAKPDAPNSETAATETPAPLPAAAAEPPPATETKLAALDAAPSPPAEAAAEDASTTTMAALGDPAAAIENTADATMAKEKADRDELRKKRRAERARERRRQAARRARLAAQQAAALAAQQQALDPFTQIMQPAQPAKPVVTTTTQRR